jgi:SAM-dependent methyltransferase
MSFRRRGSKGKSVRPASSVAQSEPDLIAEGWNDYAKNWSAGRFPVLPGHEVRHLGDEWTAEDSEGTTYGLDPAVVHRFGEHITTTLLDPHLPPEVAQGLEIGPGGGRLTALLVPRTRILHVAETSETMLDLLRARFRDESRVRYHLVEGMALPRLEPRSLDYVFSFDVFVHFEPRLVYWYLRQIAPLLADGGVGIIHYANVLTTIGWQQFETDLEENLGQRRNFAAFGVMCPALMRKFIHGVGLEVVCADTGTVPRDAVTVFRRAT